MPEHSRSSSISEFYNVLGVSTNASIREIGKKYKSLIRIWHPDKNPSNSEAQEKFTAINETYKALNSEKEEEESKNKEPTTSGTNEALFSRRSKSMRCPPPAPGPAPSLSRTTSRGPISPEYPSSISKSTSRRIVFSQSSTPKKPLPVEKKLECTLEELSTGCVKKIKITRDVLTDLGTFDQEEEVLKIHVKPGWKKGTKITFEGKGDERPGMLPADIVFSIDEKRHPLFKREGDDLELDVEIPLVKALTGFSIRVPLLGGEKKTVTFEDTVVYPGFEKIIHGKGMPRAREKGKRGDLKVKFLVEFPTNLSDEQRALIYDILQSSS